MRFRVEATKLGCGMIHYLRIQNLALLTGAELQFDGGFTCVTGETGAGKSILLGALSLLSGGRTDKTLIRQGEETCTVEAGLYLKDPEGVDAFLEEHGLPTCEEGVLLLRRSFSRERIPQIQVNGASTTLAVLKELGELWIDFHGPGEPQKLFREPVQLELLDAYAAGLDRGGKVAASLVEYRGEFGRWRELCREREALEAEAQLTEDEQEFLRGQLARMEALPLEAEAIQELERDFQRVSSAQELQELAAAMQDGLGGEGGVTDRLADLVRIAQSLPDLDAASAPLLERLRSLVVDAEDLAEGFRDLGEALEFDAETQESLESRMQVWMDLKRRHGGSLELVQASRDALAKKLETQGDLAGTLERLAAEAMGVENTLQTRAAEILKVRVKAAESLGREVVERLERLGFRQARFRIEVVATGELTAAGGSETRFLFAPNRGVELQPLNKIASSGETARVMLALKTLLARLDQTPVLVFDEVDANIGGEIGLEVGSELRRLGEHHQVLCVTHLPQVAAQGHWHFVVEKSQNETETRVEIAPVHGERARRVEEIARMLGDRKSASAARHARELLGEG